MGQRKGNPTPSYQNQAYMNLYPNDSDGRNEYNDVTNVQLDKDITLSEYVQQHLKGNYPISSSYIVVNGTIRADEYIVNKFSSSVIYTSGSSRFGDTSDDFHQFTGSVDVSGSLNLGGNGKGGLYYNGNRQFNYAQFYNKQTLSGSANTAYPMWYDTTDVTSDDGIYLSEGSKIYFKHTGVYNVQFSAQLHTTTNQAVDFSVWVAMTGSNVDNSNTDFSIEKVSGGGFEVAALNYLTRIQSGSYIELYYSKTTANGEIQAKGTQSTPTRPATPSIITTITQVG